MKVTIRDDGLRNEIEATLTRIELLKSLQRESEQLQNNWNELKKWLEDYYDYGDCLKINYILKKMQELEQGKDENN